MHKFTYRTDIHRLFRSSSSHCFENGRQKTIVYKSVPFFSFYFKRASKHLGVQVYMPMLYYRKYHSSSNNRFGDGRDTNPKKYFSVNRKQHLCKKYIDSPQSISF